MRWGGFKKRQPDVILRCANGLEVKTAIDFERILVTKFYNLLENIYVAHT